MKSNCLFALAFLSPGLYAVAQPSITFEPNDQTAIPGQRIALTISAIGLAPLTFQWQREGLSLAGKTTTSLGFTNIQAPDAGNYSAVVTDSSGSIDFTFREFLPPPFQSSA